VVFLHGIHWIERCFDGARALVFSFLETLIYHELRVWNMVSGKHRQIAYYQTGSVAEIDFVIEMRKRQPGTRPRVVCIEVKHATRWKRTWERAMRDMAENNEIEVTRQIGVYRGDRRYRFGDVDVLPVGDFLRDLHDGEVF